MGLGPCTFLVMKIKATLRATERSWTAPPAVASFFIELAEGSLMLLSLTICRLSSKLR